ncbi:two-component regulator propeller domain-containing protein [Pseudopedobacter sp.]|uniref:hybrid sensor histidine kinase/response regulator transcription factor n=1 Tax=Pseudopedobacter sp. TaxID=1936787 RepID=UPI00334062D3
MHLKSCTSDLKVFNKITACLPLTKYCWVILFCFFQTFALHSFADGIISVSHYSSADGLSDNRVTTIVKDREGFVWFGTWAGINRFDGNRFVAFKSNPGDFSRLKNNRIDEIVEDKTSSFLWVKAYDNRIYRFDKRKHIFTSLHDLIQTESFKKHQFTRILAVANGKVWLKTIKGNIVVIDDATGNRPVFNELNTLNDSSQKTHFFYLDKRGYAWISNERGLFLVRQHQNCSYVVKQYVAKADNPFRIIAEDRNGEMWLAYAKERLIKIDVHFRKKVDVKITSGLIYDIKLSKDKQQLFCTSSKGELMTVDAEGNRTLLETTPDGSALYCVYEDKDKGLWLESEHYGVMRLDKSRQKLMGLYPEKKYGFKPWLRNCTFFEDVNKQLWVSIRGYKLSVYDREKDKLIEFVLNIEGLNRSFSRIIQGVYYDPSGVLWITTDNGGLDRIILQGNLFHQNYIKSDHINKAENEVRGLFVDQKDRLWIGTKSNKILLNENGKVHIDPLGANFNPDGGIYSITQDKNGLFWIGTKGSGLYLVEEYNGGFRILQHFLNSEADNVLHRSEIYSILPDQRGRIWVATFGGGLVLIESDGKNYRVFNNENRFRNYPIDNYGKLRHLNMDKEGHIWIATSEGLILFNPDDKSDGGRFKVYKKEPGNIESLGGNDIQFIYRDFTDQMWVLTSSGGLNKAIGTNPLDTLKFKNYAKKHGLSSDFLLACTEDSEKNLWISTRNGISKFSLLNQKVQNYSYYDGLHETIFSEASVAKFSNGKLAFGNILGYLFFQAKDLNDKREKGNLVFTNFQVNSEDIIPGDNSLLKTDINYLPKVALNYNQNVVGIEFAMLESTSASRHNFVYRLLGFDDVWRNTEGQSKVVYTNLPPGNYTFQVKSQNSDLFEGVSFRSLKIEVLPPFWKTWWAYTVYTIILILLLLFVKRVAMTILRLRQGIAVEKKLAEVKLNFFTQISHELRTPLTLIVNPIEEIIQSERLSNKGKGYAKVILDNSKRMVRLVNQVLDLRKVSSGKATLKRQKVELLSFIHNICGYFENYLFSKRLTIEVQSEFSELMVDIDADKIETVIYNILANAIKFSPEGGKILLNVSSCHTSDVFRIEVIDEGPGVNQTELNKIFQLYYEGVAANNMTKGTGIGLALARELVALHNGNIYAENSTDKGLRVIVELPYLLMENKTESLVTFRGQINGLKDITIGELPEGVFVAERKTVLIVEDNLELRDFLDSKFNDYYHIELASDGEEGLQKAITLLPDLILSDIMMPKMDGIQMLNKLKNNSVTSHIPVILLTARHTVEYHIQSLKYGADYYLPKPLDIRLLFSAVNNILVQRKKFFRSVREQQGNTSVVADVKENPIITEFDKKFLDDTIKVVNDHIEDPQFNIDAVADSIGMSRSAFFKKFKSLTNMAPIDFLKDTRLERAKAMFDEGHNNISHVAYAVGFNNPKYFSTCFKAHFATTPTAYIQKCSEKFK